MRGRGRTETVRVSLTPAEKERWSQAAGEEALAVWIRQTVTAVLQASDDRRALQAEIDYDNTNPEVEQSLFEPPPYDGQQPEEAVLLGVEQARQLREQRADALLEEEWTPEKWEALPEAPPLPGEDRPFDPDCPNAPHHWLVPRNQVCSDCGGLGR